MQKQSNASVVGAIGARSFKLDCEHIKSANNGIGGCRRALLTGFQLARIPMQHTVAVAASAFPSKTRPCRLLIGQRHRISHQSISTLVLVSSPPLSVPAPPLSSQLPVQATSDPSPLSQVPSPRISRHSLAPSIPYWIATQGEQSFWAAVQGEQSLLSRRRQHFWAVLGVKWFWVQTLCSGLQVWAV